MRKFSGIKDHKEIISYASSKGLVIDTYRYDHEGSDWINISGDFGGEILSVIVSTWNGKFICHRNDEFVTHLFAKYDGEAWYDAILDIIYHADLEEA